MKAIKKVSATPIDEITGSIVDGTNIEDKTKNTYSANVIDGLVKDVYSTEEQVVGTWNDGKTLYRITGEIRVDKNTTILYGIANYNFKKVTGWIIRDDGTENQVGVYTGSTDYATIYRSDDKQGLNIATSYTGLLIYTLEYTKTTD